MFLPVLLVRDFGIAGFLVFAIPNIVGAAAMGRVLPDAQSSERFVERHGAACAAFSGVTIVFHLFVLSWVIYGLIGQSAYFITAGMLAVMLVIFLNEAATLILSWLLLAGSLVAFAYAVSQFPNATANVHFTGSQPARNLLGLAPVCLAGFFLCPYLDLTFHRARQSTTPVGGVIAFAVGFGGCFASMILFTLWYSHLLDPSRWSQIPRNIAWVIAAHMSAQSAFTIAAHLRSLAMNSPPFKNVGLGLGLFAAISTLLVWWTKYQTNSETVYRMFMGFYGLIFPAYLWINLRGPSRRALAVSAASIVFAAPMFWVGFIDGKMLWLIPGVMLILGARVLTAADRPPTAQIAGPTPFGHAPSISES
jgi:hypothetical protein